MLIPKNHHRQLVVRMFVVCCLLSAVILVWTQQYEYEEVKRKKHRRRHSGGGRSSNDQSSPGLFQSWFSSMEERGEDDEENTFTCRIHKMNMTLPQAPDVIIAGAPKCGTTTLAHWFLEHPQILPTKKWESHFFNTGIHPREFGPLLNITTQYTREDGSITTTTGTTTSSTHYSATSSNDRQDLICQLRKRYLRHWPDLIASLSETSKDDDATRYYTFDKTPDYLYPSRVPALIRALFPKQLPKIVVVLRNPIDRAYSHYRMTQRLMRAEHIPFEEFVERELHLLQELGLTDFQADFDREPTVAGNESQMTTNTVATDRMFSVEETDELYDQVSDQLQGHNYLSRGLYAMQLERWIRHGFGDEELLVIPYMELSLDPAGVYARILDFVGMPDHSLNGDILNKRFNYNNEKTESLRNATRLWLQQFYHQANEELVNLLEAKNLTMGYEWRGRWDT